MSAEKNELASKMQEVQAQLERKREEQEAVKLKEMEVAESQKEHDEWPESVRKWMDNQDNSRPTKWGDKKAHYYTFTENNYASLYRGNIFIRIIPFIKKTDLQGHMNWAQMYVNNFYDKPKEKLPWERAFIQLIWAPLNMEPGWAESIGGGGIHINVDIDAQMQVPLYFQLTQEERATMLKGNRMTVEALRWKATVEAKHKKKVNIMFWLLIAIVCGIGAIIVLIFILFPNLGSQITGAFSHLGTFIQPPSAPTTAAIQHGNGTS